VRVEWDNEVQLGGEEELRNHSQNALEVSRDPSVSLAGKTRDGSLSRNSLQLDALQEANAAGQDHVEGDTLGGQDLLQTGDRPDLNLTPVQDQNGGPALPVSPVQPDAVVFGNQDPAGEEFLLQEQSLSHSNDQQAGEEAHVSEFALLASIQALEDDGMTPVTFTRLCPSASTRSLRAATTFQGLLKLERSGKIMSEQEENFAEIIITCVH